MKGYKMNLQHAKNNPGTFQQMRATATKFDVKQGDYGPYALGTLRDEMGNEEKVLFAVKQDETLVDACCAKELGIWGVKYDANTGKFKAYYNGSVAKQLQNQQQAPQNTPQSPQPPAQRPNVPQTQDTKPVREDIRLSVLCAMLQGGIEVDYPEVLRHTAFVISGKDDSAPVDNSNANPVGNDKFCPHCGNPHAQCSCDPPF